MVAPYIAKPEIGTHMQTNTQKNQNAKNNKNLYFRRSKIFNQKTPVDLFSK